MSVVRPLDAAQALHVSTLEEQLRRHGVAFDLSPTGSGKTFHAVMVLQALCADHRLVVVCPAGLREKWRDVIESLRTGMDYTLLSYNELGGSAKRKRDPPPPLHSGEAEAEAEAEDAGSTSAAAAAEERWRSETLCSRVAHDFLIRQDEHVYDAQRQVRHSTSYAWSPSWIELLRRPGVFLVLDEVQKIKNDNANATDAAQMLVACAREHLRPVGAPPSYALLMSASPLDKAEHALQMLRTMGHLDRDRAPLVRRADAEARADDADADVVRRFAMELSPSMARLRAWCLRHGDRGSVADVEREAFSPEQQRMLGVGGSEEELRPVDADEGLRADVRSAVQRWGAQDSRTRMQVTRAFKRAGLDPKATTPGVAKDLRERAKHCAFLLFLRVVLPAQSSCKMPPDNSGHGVRVVSALFELAEQESARVRDATSDIHLGLAILRRNHAAAAGGGAARNEAQSSSSLALSKLSQGQMDLESSKVDTLCALTERTLTAHARAKVVVAVNYTRTLDTLRRRLSAWGPLVLQGATPPQQREQHRAAFQARDENHRLLIGNVRVIGHGIDLDDQHGDHPRLGLLVPNYDTIMLYQFMGRFDRALTRSSAKVLVVYTTAGMKRGEGGQAKPPPYAASAGAYPDPLTEIGEQRGGGQYEETAAAPEPTPAPTLTDIDCCETSLMHALRRKGDIMMQAMPASDAERGKVPGNARTWVQQAPPPPPPRPGPEM